MIDLTMLTSYYQLLMRGEEEGRGVGRGRGEGWGGGGGGGREGRGVARSKAVGEMAWRVQTVASAA